MTHSVLVTGGAGFVGSHVVDALIAQGDAVTVVDALVPQVHGAVSRPRFLHPAARFIHADLVDAPRWTGALAEVDAVIHLAAEVGVAQSMYEITRYVRANALGTAVLLEALLPHRDHLRKLVVASSMSIYGEGAYRCPLHGPRYPALRSEAQLARHDWELHCPTCGAVLDPLPTPEDKPLYPTSIYAITKRDHEEMLLTFGRAYKIPTIALRFFNIYGPRQALSNPYTGLGAIFSGRLLNGKPPLVYEDGLQRRDFVHISDIVQSVLLALDTASVAYDVFNVGTGEPLTVLDMAEALAREIGVDLAPRILGEFRAGDIRHCYADLTRIRAALGYRPRVPFAEGVPALVAWVRGETAVDAVEQARRELAAHGLTQ